MAGDNLALSSVSGGRINLLDDPRGVLQINADALTEINMLDGITVATVPADAVVEPKKMVATIKTIGLAVPERSLRHAEQISADGDLRSMCVECVPYLRR